jgi:hypothetical protein
MLGKRCPKKLNFLDIGKETEYFVFANYLEMLQNEGCFVLEEPDIKTPWPSLDQCWEFCEQKCFSQTRWYYEASEDFKKWILEQEAEKRAKKLRRIAKAKYKLLIRRLFKEKMKMMKIKFRNTMDLSFLRLILLTTSLLGWRANDSLAGLYGLVNLGFWLTLS